MSLIRLTAKIDANASAYHAALRQVQSSAETVGGRIARSFKAASMSFLSVAGIRMIAREMLEMLNNVEETSVRMKELGIAIDDNVVESAKRARKEWEAAKLSMEAATLSPTAKTVSWSAGVLMRLKNLMGVPGMVADSAISGEGFKLGGPFPEIYQQWMSDMRGMKGAGLVPDEIEKKISEREKRLADAQSRKTPKAASIKEIAEAGVSLAQGDLAKIGGFTGRAGEELKSIQFRQLQKLERIETNTEPLKRGIG